MKRQTSDSSLTDCAARQLQQSGIPLDTLVLLQQFGRRVYSHNGACALIFDQRSRRQIKARLGKAAAQLKLTAFAVVDAKSANSVISAGHRTARIREHA
jgi:hypothetical protein